MDDINNLTETQAKDIISNPDNPLHGKFYQNDGQTVQAVNRAFTRAHPGERQLGHDPQLERIFDKAAESLPEMEQQQGQPVGEVDFTPEQKAAGIQAEHALRQEWGFDFKENVELAAEEALKMFKGDRQKLADFLVDNDLDVDPQKQAEAARFLLKLAKKR